MRSGCANDGFIENSSFTEWVKSKKKCIFGFQVYKRLFTPYEQQNAFLDESEFTDIHYHICKIVEAAPLGNGEWWVGLAIMDDATDVEDQPSSIEYYRLSDIRLFVADWMQNESEI